MISSSLSVHHCVSKMPRASQCNARNKRFDVDFTAEESIWKWRSKTNLFKWQSNILQRGFPMDPIFYCTMWHKYNNFGTFIPTEILVNFCRCSTWHFPKADENFKTHKNKWSRRSKMWNEAPLLRLQKLNSNCLVSWILSALELGEDAWSSVIGIMLRPTAQCALLRTNWANVHNISTSCHSTILPHTWKLAASTHRSWNIPPLWCSKVPAFGILE